MSDKPLIQQDLARNLARLPLSLSDEKSILYIRAFYDTMIREWAGIDKLRSVCLTCVVCCLSSCLALVCFLVVSGFAGCPFCYFDFDNHMAERFFLLWVPLLPLLARCAAGV